MDHTQKSKLGMTLYCGALSFLLPGCVGLDGLSCIFTYSMQTPSVEICCLHEATIHSNGFHLWECSVLCGEVNIPGSLSCCVLCPQADAIMQLYPSAERVGLQSGHCPHDDTPAEANKALLGWLARLKEKASTPQLQA